MAENTFYRQQAWFLLPKSCSYIQQVCWFLKERRKFSLMLFKAAETSLSV